MKGRQLHGRRHSKLVTKLLLQRRIREMNVCGRLFMIFHCASSFYTLMSPLFWLGQGLDRKRDALVLWTTFPKEV